MKPIVGAVSMALAGMLAGCAFDIVRVRQHPTTFSAIMGPPDHFTLVDQVEAKLGTGFPTYLRAGTKWAETGLCGKGTVYGTDDQIVKVEASNISEARIVVAGDRLVGFYLPVEQTFAPITHPVVLHLDRGPFLSVQ